MYWLYVTMYICKIMASFNFHHDPSLEIPLVSGNAFSGVVIPNYQCHHRNPGFLVRCCNSLPSRAIRKLEIIMIDMVNVLYSISGLGLAVHMHMAVSDVTHHPAHRMCPWCACHIKDGKLRNLLPCLVLWATSIGPSLALHVTQGLPCCHGVSNGSLMASHENSCIARFASQGVPRRWLWAVSELLVHVEHHSNTKTSWKLQLERDKMVSSESGSIARFAGKGASELRVWVVGGMLVHTEHCSNIKTCQK